MGFFNRNKNPKPGFRQKPGDKPISREKKTKQLLKKGFSQEQIDHGFMLEENVPIAIGEFNKVCKMIERLGFRPQVELEWHGTGCDSQIVVAPISLPEYSAMEKATKEKEEQERGKKRKADCDTCKDLPEGQVTEGHDHRIEPEKEAVCNCPALTDKGVDHADNCAKILAMIPKDAPGVEAADEEQDQCACGREDCPDCKAKASEAEEKTAENVEKAVAGEVNECNHTFESLKLSPAEMKEHDGKILESNTCSKCDFTRETKPASE